MIALVEEANSKTKDLEARLAEVEASCGRREEGGGLEAQLKIREAELTEAKVEGKESTTNDEVTGG